MKRYNLALLPQNISAEALRLSTLFAALSDNYLLGPASHPHVTICQFYAEETQLAGIWEQSRRLLTENSLHLIFKQITAELIQEKFWVQLIPEPHERLHQFHLQMAEIVKEPLGLARAQYSPHLTLANIKKDQQEAARAQVAAMRVVLEDDFILSLGNCDENGQVTSLIEVRRAGR